MATAPIPNAEHFYFVKMKKRDAVILSATKSDMARFLSKVHFTEKCWIFFNGNKNTYGKFTIKNTGFAAHRAAKIWHSGHPGGVVFALHKCNFRGCVNPDHIKWGSHKENSADRRKRDLNEDGFDSRLNTSGENHHKAKLTKDDIHSIWHRYHNKGEAASKIAKSYGMHATSVSEIVLGNGWKRVTKDLVPKRTRRTIDFSNLAKNRPKPGIAKGERNKSSKINTADVLEIRRMAAKNFPAKEIGLKFGITQVYVYCVVSRKTWKHIPDEHPPIAAVGDTYFGVDHTDKKLTDQKVTEIRRAVLSGKTRVSQAKKYGVSATKISHIMLGKNWTHVPWPDMTGGKENS